MKKSIITILTFALSSLSANFNADIFDLLEMKTGESLLDLNQSESLEFADCAYALFPEDPMQALLRAKDSLKSGGRVLFAISISRDSFKESMTQFREEAKELGFKIIHSERYISEDLDEKVSVSLFRKV